MFQSRIHRNVSIHVQNRLWNRGSDSDLSVSPDDEARSIGRFEIYDCLRGRYARHVYPKSKIVRIHAFNPGRIFRICLSATDFKRRLGVVNVDLRTYGDASGRIDKKMRESWGSEIRLTENAEAVEGIVHHPRRTGIQRARTRVHEGDSGRSVLCGRRFEEHRRRIVVKV